LIRPALDEGRVRPDKDQTGSGAHPAFFSIGTGGSFLGVKVAGAGI